MNKINFGNNKIDSIIITTNTILVSFLKNLISQQYGIDKSLLYMKTLNMNNPNEINTYSTTPISQTTKNIKSQTFNKKRKISKNKTQNIRPISAKSATTKIIRKTLSRKTK